MKKILFSICCVFLFNSFCCYENLKAQDKKDSLVNVAFGKINSKDLLGAVSSVKVSEIIENNYSTYSLDGLQGYVGGYNGNIWGQSALLLVDGIVRSAYDVNTAEIETVTILKGASAVVLYGSKAAKGAILITTKRGKDQPLTIRARANTGLSFVKSLPSYLNASEYMTLYNEAYVNDGLATSSKPLYYSQDLIDNTASGLNKYRYPDIDFYNSDYMRNAVSSTEATAEITGGNRIARYYTNFGLAYNNGLLKYGYHDKDHDLRFNIRANIDVNLTKWLSASINASTVFDDNYTGRGDFWGASSTLRPNWISTLLPIDMIDATNTTMQSLIKNSNNIVDGKYLLGGNSTTLTNAFADGYASGYIKNKNRTFMFDVNVGADLESILKGLTFKANFALDYRNFYSEAWQQGYAVYEPVWSTVDGKDVITDLKKYNTDGNTTNESVGSTRYIQTNTITSQFNYDRVFGKYHKVSAALIGWGFQIQNSADTDNQSTNTQEVINTYYHKISNLNLGLQLAYNYKQRYYVDFSSALVHSAKLPEGKRDAFSPSLTLGWRLSEEGFMKDNLSFIDNLKLTTSYAKLNQDLDISNYYMYQGYFNRSGGWYQWRDGAAGGGTSTSVQGSNFDLTFAQREEVRVGLEASLLKEMVSLDLNYFNQNTNGLLTRGASTIYPSYYTDFLPYVNFNKDNRQGVDFTVNVKQKFGKLESILGLSGMFFNSKAVVRDERYEDSYQNRAGKILDSSWGYVCDGFFGDQADITNHAKQSFGEVKPGDLKYRDMNNDGVINTKDQVNLGHNGYAVSPFTYGVNLTLKWNNFTLFAMGSGQSGAIGFKNSSYYWVTGNAKYSEVVKGRWTENTKETATYPRLSTLSNTNNFMNSTFWMYKTDRFDLRKIQLTYTFPESVIKGSFVKGLNIYVNGSDLLTISSERKHMDTNIGVSPQLRTYSFGIKADF